MEAVAVSTAEPDSGAAGETLAQQIQFDLDEAPDAVIVFAAPHYDHAILLRALIGKQRRQHPACAAFRGRDAELLIAELFHQSFGQTITRTWSGRLERLAQWRSKAAAQATDPALAAIGELRPKAALLFDCVARRLRCGDHFAAEVAAVTNKIGDAALVGCNTHGQIVRAEGQFEAFHNCTAVVCVFAE